MKQSAMIIHQQLEKLIQIGPVSVMLTGGRAAAQLYTEWNKIPNFKK